MEAHPHPNLVLSRKEHESIIIGEGSDRVVITVASISRGHVRLAISAPREVPIDRAELRAAKKREGKQ